ncbi:MAG: 2-succinyl-5-enolpyruvyl-6-hydroxy-3-cyclohexene-1-carboxylic-acid synthase [Desulfobacterales bacterium]|nr:2-succinyl-5-enolpyruvyl-6-hydroxy-3-cyclohexene-1-carboxylic-acid synthase [Desulfobacterales bacterium]
MAKKLLTQNINMVWSCLIIEELIKNKIDTFFISPGSRNSPLISALVYNDDAIKISVIDERAAAFCALGYAKAKGKPAVVICTSGTALSNYYPAVIEAYRDELPIIVLSADRPPELVDSDANQTIDQIKIFGKFSIKNLILPCPTVEYPLNTLVSKIDYITSIKSGPVHINCPFREPLSPIENYTALDGDYIIQSAKLFNSKIPYSCYNDIKKISYDLTDIKKIIEASKKGLIAIGRIGIFEDINKIKDFLNQIEWPVFCDISSSLKWIVPSSMQIFSFDHPLSVQTLKQYSPDTILQLGTALVSTQYYKTILNNDVQNIILVSEKRGYRDPSHKVNIQIKTSISSFIDSIDIKNNDTKQDKSSTKILFDSLNNLYSELKKNTPNEVLSFPIIAEIINQEIQEKEALFIGNSIVIRAFDSLLSAKPKQVSIISNRGVSGIEGNIATSIGYAKGSGSKVTAVIGDISFLHDLNSLFTLKELQNSSVIIIVINNQGGRIFERLPINNFPEIMTPYMTTPHNMNFKSIAEQFSIPYFIALTPLEFKKSYNEALNKNTNCLIEAAISPNSDLKIYRDRINISHFM